MLFENKLSTFKAVATAEGISFIVLLFIAMPLKYMFGMPIATKIVGMLHGGLFIWYMVALFNAKKEYNFSTKFTAWAFLASLLPFATFYLEKQLKVKLEEVKNS